MDIINEILLRSGLWARSHMGNITLALIATLLVIYGDDINRFVKRQLKPYPRFVRLIGFVIMCAFGYGALTVLFTPVLAGWFSLVNVKWLAPLVVGIFLFVGWLAERKHQM
ncbi:DUF3392 domain-containing protein [Marinospirillum alkaliphilum]|uniref:DUF3392 domain-containing protein n=1 Tax=Marinospirillum alkaliphilum DSM 21637 TaxID=1122209 RepID=A0A1K1ZIL6_9GAMM|nr:DUF3392 domain-containing protein [Marinospirillum alkaliphilum]SFX73532.1 Protein of unknown function [Marinospirillum alkaliphilum DSM 21637]